MTTTLVLAAVLLTTAADDATTSWTSFRNGGASLAAGTNLPTKWSPEAGVAWQRELPGYGQSTPLVWRDTVYVAAVEGPAKEQGLLLALNAREGMQDQSRDPIVYGAAAAGDALFVRTGTRLYCVRSAAKVATNP